MVLDPSEDKQVADEDTLPKGKEPPLMILFSSEKNPLKEVMELTITNFIKEDSFIIATDDYMNEMKELDKDCKILGEFSLSGIESQWICITADDQPWRYETLSRGRNGLVILLDMSKSNWYVFMCCYYV